MRSLSVEGWNEHSRYNVAVQNFFMSRFLENYIVTPSEVFQLVTVALESFLAKNEKIYNKRVHPIVPNWQKQLVNYCPRFGKLHYV